MRYCLLPLALAAAVVALPAVSAADPVTLPGTQPLTAEGDLAAQMVAGMHKYLDRALAESVEKRQQFWKLDFSSPEAYRKSVEPNRERLRKYIGVVDNRLPPRMDDPLPIDGGGTWGIIGGGHAIPVRWAVLPGVDAEGVLIWPKDGPVLADVVAIPHSDQSPEDISSLTGKGGWWAARLAEQGCRVLIPTMIDRRDTYSGSAKLNRTTNIPHREFVHRMAFEMGRTLPGYEVQKVLAAADWFTRDGSKRPLGVIGYGDGGMIALYAAALDERFGVCQVSGDFGSRDRTWQQPIDRNVWGLLREFGDAELGMLVAPRKLIVDRCPGPKWDGPTTVAGRSGAAPGRLEPIPAADIDRELDRLRTALGGKFPPTIVGGKQDGVEIDAFVTKLGKEKLVEKAVIHEVIGAPYPVKIIPDRQKRQFDQLVTFTQKLWCDSDATRKEFWKKADASSPAAWEKSCDWYRDYFHTEVIGKLPEPTVPPNPRTRRVYDEPKWTGYEVMLDVYPDVVASGILLLPKDMKPGEKRPVVVCQHGLEGTPRHTINLEKQPVYDQFSRKLAEQGYIVYAPQNPYYGENTFRQLQRKANPLKLSLFSFIIRQHQRTLDWLEALPNADPKRIAFYGLSYGGKTAMRVPAVEKRYCLSICSGDFNEWIGKNVSVDLERGYMWSREYEMYEFDLGNTFNYAEMAALIAPRPFMVERGHDDLVGTDEMVSWEYARVRYLYANRLKIADRTEIEYRVGGHRVFGEGTYRFLAKHLNWEPK